MNSLNAEDDIITCGALEKNVGDWGYAIFLAGNGTRGK